MSDIWDERKKALEEEYFRKREKELIEKLRAEIAAETMAKDFASGIMHCPRCDGGHLSEVEYEGLNVHRCTKCQGWWLDSGELEQLMRREQGGFVQRLWDSFTTDRPR